jgi:metal-responsive CopG/Arc/MetJ family transcriptional regulator
MKVKTSVSLSKELLDELDGRLGDGSRSEFIERVLKQRLREIRRDERNARDAEIYRRLADDPAFQQEVQETLEDAVPWWELGDEIELTDELEARIARENELRAAG